MVYEVDVKKNLSDNYKKIGPLSRQEFVAVKSLTQRVVYVRNVSEIIRADWFGQEEKITPAQIQEGDMIKVSATARNMAGGQERPISVVLEDIRHVTYDRETNFLMIENDQYCLVNVDCKNDIDILKYLIANPNVWVNQEILTALIPAGMTLQDFEEVKKEKEAAPVRTAPDREQEVSSLELLF